MSEIGDRGIPTPNEIPQFSSEEEQAHWVADRLGWHAHPSKFPYSVTVPLRIMEIRDLHNPADFKHFQDFLRLRSLTEKEFIQHFPAKKTRKELIETAQTQFKKQREMYLRYEWRAHQKYLSGIYPTFEEFAQNQEEFALKIWNASPDKGKISFEEWIHIFQAMRDDFVTEYVVERLLGEKTEADAWRESAKGKPGYFFEEIIKKGGLGWAQERYPAHLSETDLLVHSLSKNRLISAMVTGRLGIRGWGRVCYSKNRVTQKDDFALIFRASELKEIYDLLDTRETEGDIGFLREVRQHVAAYLNLALRVIPITTEYFADADTKFRISGSTIIGEKELAEIRKSLK